MSAAAVTTRASDTSPSDFGIDKHALYANQRTTFSKPPSRFGVPDVISSGYLAANQAVVANRALDIRALKDVPAKNAYGPLNTGITSSANACTSSSTIIGQACMKMKWVTPDFTNRSIVSIHSCLLPMIILSRAFSDVV